MKSFEEWFEEYCDDNCPTEGYDDAKEASEAAFNAAKTEMKANISIDEVQSLLVYMTTNDLNTATIEHKSNGIGSQLLVSDSWNTPQKDITDYGSW